MKLIIFIALIFIFTSSFIFRILQQFNRTLLYETMQSNDLSKVDECLLALNKSGGSEREPMEGALLMKKAGLVANSKNKLNLFKSGRGKLENSITKDSTNAEWRFLRMMIQEHAPKILNYRRELYKDSQFISKHFESLAPVVQQAVKGYSRQSKVLNPALFK